MNIQERVITRVAKRVGTTEFNVEPSPIYRQLLLFDTCIIRSARLTEISHIATTAGFDAAKALLESGAVQLHWDWLAITGSFEQNGVPALPPLHFSLGQMRIGQAKQFIHRCLQPFHEIPVLSHKQVLELKKLVVSRLVEGTKEHDDLVLAQLKNHLRQNATVVRKAVDHELVRRLGTVEIPTYSLSFDELPGLGFRATTDLPRRVGWNVQQCHDAIQGAIFALANLEVRLAEMRTFCAITGFNEDDSRLFTAHCDFLLSQLNPYETEASFHRVVTLANLPEINAATASEINIPLLLEIRQSDECREFRHWLSTISEAPDEEIRDRVASLNAKVANALHCTTGKVMRFIASTGLGAIPVVGPVAGAAAGFVDSFLLERIFPKRGPISFISKTYPSIFKEH